VARFDIRRCFVLLALVSALAFVVAGCGSSKSSSASASSSSASPATATGSASASSSTTSTVSHAKTKFVLHAGLAFGAFHRWIYKPAKAGELSHPLQHKATTVKAALAAGFVYHQLKLALDDAKADPTLSKVVDPLTNLIDKIKALPGEIKGGGTTSGSADNLNGMISSIKDHASSAGQPITEQTPATPSG